VTVPAWTRTWAVAYLTEARARHPQRINPRAIRRSVGRDDGVRRYRTAAPPRRALAIQLLLAAELVHVFGTGDQQRLLARTPPAGVTRHAWVKTALDDVRDWIDRNHTGDDDG
jgi:hypothetical protein